ncbi:MAG: hypothetical protein B7X99_07135 [Rhizobiales bacterium 17-65-6]|nr:MAG: hypothetical protein B7X99_07135 [Rhizobiales bacterium 17-65-6]
MYVVLAHSDGGYVDVSVPDFPGLTSAGETAEMALRALDECWRDVVSGLREDGLPIPEPTPSSALERSVIDGSKIACVFLRPLPA